MEGKATRTNIQKMELEHLDSIMKIERTSSENFWNHRTFESHLKTKNCKALVAMQGGSVVGYVAYELDPVSGTIQIWNLVVAPRHRSKGVGRALVAELQDLVGCEFDVIHFNVRESNLDSQLFLQKLDFKCNAISRSYFIDWRVHERREEDAYCFVYNPNKKGRDRDVPFRITTRLGVTIAQPRNGANADQATKQPHCQRTGSRQG